MPIRDRHIHKADVAFNTLGDSLAPSHHPERATWIEMRNVNLRVTPAAVLHVRRLHGQLISTPGTIPFLDDPTSFAIRIVSGSVALSGNDLSVMLNTFVFNYPGSPLKRLHVRVVGGQIIQTGVMHKVVDLPFEITASLSITPAGLVRIHPSRIRMLGINGGGLLHAVGLHLDNLLDLHKAHGASVHGDDLYLDPAALLPPPAIIGRLASIRIEGEAIVQDFVRLPQDTLFMRIIRPDSTVPNFVYFRGGQLRFGKLLMSDTDLLIVDADPRDPFDLYLARYTGQLIAGTSRTLAGLGLRVVMPDYHTLRPGQ
jgi:hypothetical protein